MDFDLTDQQRMIRDTVREFVEREIIPNAQEWDRKSQFPRETFREMGKLGFLGMPYPVEYGGGGADYLSFILAIEELARGDGSVAITVASHTSLAAGQIYLAGTEEQKRRYLVPLARGEKLGSWGLTEHGSGSDASALRTRAVRRGDKWILNGSKMFITQGSVGSIHVVLASTAPEKKQRGITAFIVENDTPGFRVGKQIEKVGLHASDTAELIFEDAEVPSGNILGREDEGFVDALKLLDGGRIGIGAMSVGLGRGALEQAIDYSRQREQFGVPIASHQAIRWMIADAATELDAARLLVWRAAVLRQRGLPHSREASMAKLFASETGSRACNRALQIHGGYGYTTEFPVQRHWRDVRLCEIGEGTSEIQRMIIARHLLGKS